MGPGKERKKKKKIGLQCGIVFADESGIEKEKEKKKRLFFLCKCGLIGPII